MDALVVDIDPTTTASSKSLTCMAHSCPRRRSRAGLDGSGQRDAAPLAPIWPLIVVRPEAGRLDAAIADARNPNLQPWQRAFAAAAYNALHAGLATGALRADCYGGQICPTAPSTNTPSEVLLPTPPTDGSGAGFDVQVTVAAFSVAVWSLDRMAASGQAPGRGGELTRAGLSYDKHMKRGQLPLVSGGKASLDAAGRALLEDILTHLRATTEPVKGGRFAGGVLVHRPDGVGAVFDRQGTFVYFGVGYRR